jgi:hypothetical protein
MKLMPKNLKTEHFNMILTKEEKEFIRTEAKKRNLTITDLIKISINYYIENNKR